MVISRICSEDQPHFLCGIYSFYQAALNSKKNAKKIININDGGIELCIDTSSQSNTTEPRPLNIEIKWKYVKMEQDILIDSSSYLGKETDTSRVYFKRVFHQGTFIIIMLYCTGHVARPLTSTLKY